MADVVLYKNVEKALAKEPFVQGFLDDVVFVMESVATVSLIEHKQEGHAYIETAKGRVDRYLILVDERGQKAAMSIEYGRAGYIDPESGEVWGAMEPLYILTRAANLPKRRKVVKREVRRRPSRGRGGRFSGGGG
jgi:hypothetical protein